MQVAITGSSGLIGTELRRALDISGHQVVRLVRGGASTSDSIRWDPMAGAIDAAGLEGIDAVVHLAGESIGSGRWTETQKARILDSRVHGTTLLARTIASLSSPPKVFVSGSAVGYYGDGRDQVLTEDSPSGAGFLADVVRRWESAATPAQDAGIRIVWPRTGIVLSRDGGALSRMLLPFKLGLGGRVGSGRQYWSWISIHDEVGGILHAIESEDLVGAVNLTAPDPVTQGEFASTLARVLGRPAFLPTPVFGVKAVYGNQMVEETLLWGQRALPKKLEASGYRFMHPTLDEALRSVVRDAA
jgi:uncharacterized protein (TIGR01777 family)